MPPFQFHKGTIRTGCRGGRGAAQADFNSIKVRLELDSDGGRCVLIGFQFHKGTIRTYQGAKVIRPKRISIP